MHTELLHYLESTPEPPSELSDAEYIDAALREFRRFSPAEFRQRPTVAPERALTEGELAALAHVGTVPDRRMREDAAAARKEALYVFFRAFKTARTTTQIASMLGVHPSRIRQRVKERTLLALVDGGESRFPALQFHESNEIPGLKDVLPALPQGIKVLEALSWLATPTAELASDAGEPRSPRDYLLATGESGPVVELAKALRRGEAA